jgi:hypothetical protein
MRYIGIDLHTTNFTVCYLSEAGPARFAQYRLDQLAKFQRGLQPEDWVAIEATGNVRYFCTAIAASVAKIGVCEIVWRFGRKGRNRTSL